MSNDSVLALIEADLNAAEVTVTASQAELRAAKQAVAEKEAKLAVDTIKRDALKDLAAKAAALYSGEGGAANADEEGEAPEDSGEGSGEGSGLAPVTSLSNRQRDQLALMILLEVGRFIARSDVRDEFERRGYDTEIHHIKTVLSRLLKDGRIVQLRYGTSSHYSVYGHPDFVRPYADGDYTFVNDGVKPSFHDERKGDVMHFEFNRSEVPDLLNVNTNGF